MHVHPIATSRGGWIGGGGGRCLLRCRWIYQLPQLITIFAVIMVPEKILTLFGTLRLYRAEKIAFGAVALNTIEFCTGLFI